MKLCQYIVNHTNTVAQPTPETACVSNVHHANLMRVKYHTAMHLHNNTDPGQACTAACRSLVGITDSNLHYVSI
jgi:hypothetical protein